MFGKLQSFNEEHGHCKVPKGYTRDLELANWVRNQRLEYANLQRGKKVNPCRQSFLDLIMDVSHFPVSLPM